MLRILFIGHNMRLAQAVPATGHRLVGIAEPSTRRSGLYGFARAVYRALRGRGFGRLASATGATLLPGRDINSPEFVRRARELAPDVILCSTCGQIFHEELLAVPRIACVNRHTALLPEHRGPTTIWALLQGDPEAGVTYHVMDRGVDTGPIIARLAYPILPTDTAQAIGERAHAAGLAALPWLLNGLEDGSLAPTPQSADNAHYDKAPTLHDIYADWSLGARAVHNRIRARCPKPGMPVFRGEKRHLLTFSAICDDVTTDAPPGTVLHIGVDVAMVSAGDGTLLVGSSPRGLRGLKPGDVLTPLRASVWSQRPKP